MRTVGKFERALQSENGVYEITFSTRDKFAIMKLKEYREDTLSIDIAKKKGKRSLNANAYYWVLAETNIYNLSKPNFWNSKTKEINIQMPKSTIILGGNISLMQKARGRC